MANLSYIQFAHLKMSLLGVMTTEDSLSPSILQLQRKSLTFHAPSTMARALSALPRCLFPSRPTTLSQGSTPGARPLFPSPLLLTLIAPTSLQFSSALKNRHVSGLHFLEANQGTKTFVHFLKVAKLQNSFQVHDPTSTPPSLEQLDKYT